MATYPHRALQPSPPAPPASAAVCRLYTRVLDLGGEPLAFRALLVAPYASPSSLAQSGNVSVGEPRRAFSDRHGYLQIDLLRGARVLVLLPGTLDYRPFTVPDLAVAPLLEHLYPYPLRSLFVTVDEDGTPSELEVEAGEASVPVGTRLGLGVEWSNGELMLLKDPGPMYLDSEVLDIAGSVVEFGEPVEGLELRSGLEETVDPDRTGSLWVRVGYERTESPLHVPALSDAFSLADPVILTVQ